MNKVKQIRFYKVCFCGLFFLFIMACAGAKKIKSRERLADKVITTVHSFVGTPYLWGGTTRAGMDCSGLALVAFRAIDINLPRVSIDQSKAGDRVKKKAIKSGDLLFFSIGKRKNEIDHVGIVTNVEGKKSIKFIHASSQLGVIETNLYSPYFIKRFKWARRVIK